MTRISKWLLYIASYKWAYLLQCISVIIAETLRTKNTVPGLQVILKALLAKRYILLVLLVMFLVSWVIEKQITRVKANTRVKYEIEDDIIGEIAISLIAYMATVLTITINLYGILLTVALFVAIGVVCDKTDKIYILPIFFLRKYRVFKSGNIKIITKMSMDRYRLKLDETPDGIPARELVRNTYLIID